LEQMRQYVLDNYKMGVTWNPHVCGVGVPRKVKDSLDDKGVPVAQYIAAASAPPAPPPAPSASASGSSSAEGIDGIFAELNRGEAVTKGLRKVDKSEMTHKNPALRAGSVVSGSTPGKQRLSTLHACCRLIQLLEVVVTKPAKASSKNVRFALEGNKWVIVSSPVYLLGSRVVVECLAGKPRESIQSRY
jgi:adenylyl cyclase-associated protein